MPMGQRKRPGPAPKPPHDVRNRPPAVNFCTRWFSSSTTYTAPAESTAIPVGFRNRPGALPSEPHSRTRSAA